jgi:hypothetical protein
MAKSLRQTTMSEFRHYRPLGATAGDVRTADRKQNAAKNRQKNAGNGCDQNSERSQPQAETVSAACDPGEGIENNGFQGASDSAVDAKSTCQGSQPARAFVNVKTAANLIGISVQM